MLKRLAEALVIINKSNVMKLFASVDYTLLGLRSVEGANGGT